MNQGRGQRIVIADGDRTVLELLQIRLEVAGYHAHVARTGKTVIELLQHLRPAAMILDVKLGEEDGFQVLKAVRARHPELHFPILVTGKALKVEDVQRALSLGAQNCMIKPFSGADAVERVGRLLAAANKPAPLQQPKPAVWI